MNSFEHELYCAECGMVLGLDEEDIFHLSDKADEKGRVILECGAGHVRIYVVTQRPHGKLIVQTVEPLPR